MERIENNTGISKHLKDILVGSGSLKFRYPNNDMDSCSIRYAFQIMQLLASLEAISSREHTHARSIRS